ncbi:Signal transduction histidine kinase [Halorubrum aquaticum]|uniref:histidine kinase n=1 Tax=Halorubrum aquaticum TaxID=387340 RepID=A0A1I2ZTQ0_9EURY|nr:ATP-binding protein [Halorubrum aquaticum]SFH41154.1 Signal transduction histidine kinase [Halorubrum aquaticum]
MNVLCVDGDPDSLERTAASVRRELPDARPRSAGTAEEALDLLSGEPVECVVTAQELPDRTGIELLESVRSSHGEVPFVLAPKAGTGSEVVASEAVASGVSAYVPSEGEGADRGARIVACVREAVGRRDAPTAAERDRQLVALHEANAALISATTREEVATVAVEAMSDIHGLVASTVYLYDEEANVVEPIASTDAAMRLSWDTDGPPAYGPGESIVWRVFERGRAEAVGDVPSDPDVANPETTIQSQLTVPLEGYGVLVTGSHVPNAFDERDVTLGRILAGNVVAALEQLDRRRELARRNERLDEFASVVSHDLRNPLSVAVGRLELARTVVDDDSPANEHLESVEYALDRIETLIDDLLRLAREATEALETESVSFPDLLEHCRGAVDVDGATLRAETDRAIYADEGRVRQCFENLVRNSVEHSSTGSRIPEESGDSVEHGSTGSRASPGDSVEHGSTGSRPQADRGPTVVVGELPDGSGFFLEDDGPGIPPEDRKRVFEAGYSTGRDGTGFGLRIVERIVESHGWEIAVTEGEAGGARFEVTGVEFVADDPEE